MLEAISVASADVPSTSDSPSGATPGTLDSLRSEASVTPTGSLLLAAAAMEHSSWADAAAAAQEGEHLLPRTTVGASEGGRSGSSTAAASQPGAEPDAASSIPATSDPTSHLIKNESLQVAVLAAIRYSRAVALLRAGRGAAARDAADSLHDVLKGEHCSAVHLLRASSSMCQK